MGVGATRRASYSHTGLLFTHTHTHIYKYIYTHIRERREGVRERIR